MRQASTAMGRASEKGGELGVGKKGQLGMETQKIEA